MKEKDDKFKLYRDGDDHVSNVPPPRIIAKRYVPKQQADQAGQGITMLVLSGVGSIKEARLTEHTG